MKIEDISLSGYRSIEPSKPISLKGFGHVNVFIGPNNCGKSAIFRFLQTLSIITARDGFKLASNLPHDQVDDSWWWAQDRTHTIEALLLFNGQPTCHLDPSLPGQFYNGSGWRIKICLEPGKKGNCSLIIAPQIWIKNGWLDLISCKGKQFVHLNRDGEYISSNASDNCPYHDAALELVKSWSIYTKFFDPVRALDRAGGRRGMIDGNGLLKELAESQQDPRQAKTFGAFRSALVARLNSLIFIPVGMKPIRSLEIKGSAERNDLDIFLTHDDEGPVVSLQHMGTGIAELVVLLATIIREQDEQRLYFLEEPETHLHPALVRRLLREIHSISKGQFFVSTHSNNLLDALTSEDRIYQFIRKGTNGTEARRCDVLTQHHDILDDLGVSGGSLLQANCIVWVEGPSDKIYLAKWLSRQAPHLLEGSDYVFSLYGGRILSHFSFIDQDALISLIKINRFSAVVMDSDTSSSQYDADIRDTKARIRKEAEADPTHRLAILTEGREIENDLGLGVLSRALSNVISTHADAWKTFEPNGSATFARQAAQRALPGGSKDDVDQLARRIQKNKVEIARVAVTDANLATPGYISKLIAFIGKSRSE